MRSWMRPLVLLVAGLSTGCELPLGQFQQGEKVQLLFPAGGEYRLVNAMHETVGYVFAENEAKPSRQTLRWILLKAYEPPYKQPVDIEHVTDITTVEDFAKFAIETAKSDAAMMYVKSFADTYSIKYDNVPLPVVPVPLGRRAPDPPGRLPTEAWLTAKHSEAVARQSSSNARQAGGYLEIDGGTVGIRPGVPLIPPPTPAPPAPAVIGIAVASPQLEDNAEDWFMPTSKSLLGTGLDHMTLVPFPQTYPSDMAKPTEGYVVIVVNSSYYPGFVPNDW